MNVSCVYKVCLPEFLLAHGENVCHTLQGQICLPPPRSGQSYSIYCWWIQVSVYPIPLCLLPNSPWFRFTFVWIDIKYQDWESLIFHAVWCDKAHIMCVLGWKNRSSRVWPSLQLELKLWVPLEEAQVGFCFIQEALPILKNRSLLAN